MCWTARWCSSSKVSRRVWFVPARRSGSQVATSSTTRTATTATTSPCASPAPFRANPASPCSRSWTRKSSSGVRTDGPRARTDRELSCTAPSYSRLGPVVSENKKGKKHEDRCYRWDRAHRIAGSQDPERERARGGAALAVHRSGPAHRAGPARGADGGRRRGQPDELADLRRRLTRVLPDDDGLDRRREHRPP